VIPDFLELVDLPENSAVRRYLVQVLNAQIAALAKCQDDSGLWHTLLDDPTYLEASATAGFAYGILKAVRKRYVARRMRRWRKKRFAASCRISHRKGSCCKRRSAPAWVRI
jgi:unsaturated rhamnogalacturonyl hydrolase